MVTTGTNTSKELERLMPALVWIQTHLDGDLSLDALARTSSLSPNHFHRLFRAGVGETTKSYVQRVRLERAAFLLGVETHTVLEIALDLGFQNHETFSRAFKRHFGQTPTQYRITHGIGPGSDGGGFRHGWEEQATSSLSKTSIRSYRSMGVAFIRHLGPYEEVPAQLWRDLVSWARSRGQSQEHLLMGVGHDAPGITPPDKLRFDACLLVDESFPPEGRIAYQKLPGGHFAATTHVGPYTTLPAAWAEVFGRVMAMKKHVTKGLPVFEIYRSNQISPGNPLNETELCLPVTPL